MATASTITVNAGSFAVWQLYDSMLYGSVSSRTATSYVLKMSWSKTTLTVSGNGLAYDADGNLIWGEITGFTLSADLGPILWKIENTSFPANGFTAMLDFYRTDGDTKPLDGMMATHTWIMRGAYDHDQFTGGDFNDSLQGGWGGDVFIGGKGNDTIDGGPRWDNLTDERDNGEDYDSIDYSRENGSAGVIIDLTKVAQQINDPWGYQDTVFNIESFTGTNMDDSFRGSDTAGFNIFTGLAGNDTINGGTGFRDEVRYDRESGLQGVKVYLAEGSAIDSYNNNDTLIGIERVRGTQWNDEIYGNDANNVFRGLAGNDIINGGGGFDRARYDSDKNQRTMDGRLGTNGIVVDLESGYARDGFGDFDQLFSIEGLDSTDSADRVLGSSQDNVLNTYAGSDYVDARGGNDTVDAGDGNDKVLGGAGNDSLYGGGAADELQGGIGADILAGGTGWDTLDGGDGEDTAVFSGRRSDYAVVQEANGRLVITDGRVSGDGIDWVLNVEYFKFSDGTLSLAQVTAKPSSPPPSTDVDTAPTPPPPAVDRTTSTDLTLTADVRNVTAIGGADVQLTGNALDNGIVGNTGRNTINGWFGDDTLNGGLGNDVLIGSYGNDKFVFSTKPSSKNKDKIVDFKVVEDTIWLDNAIFKKLGKKGSEAAPATLSKKFFKIGSKAKDKDDYVVYDNKKGVLYYDADGSGKGKAIAIATLSKKLKMTYSDFEII